MKIGDEVYVHGYVDEIRKDCIIIRNDGGYFGTVPSEVEIEGELITDENVLKAIKAKCEQTEPNDDECKGCIYDNGKNLMACVNCKGKEKSDEHKESNITQTDKGIDRVCE